jgi:polysaccharide biosynthesis/export protein
MNHQIDSMTEFILRPLHRSSSAMAVLAIGATLFLGSGCKTPEPALPLVEAAALSNSVVRLNPGDVVQVKFPGAPTMDTMERVRLDGHITMPLIDEVQAAGRTPAELQGDLIKAYGTQLQVKEVVVIISSSSSSIFVAGAVLRPGRITMERPMTVLDAIMEAGGFDPRRANVTKVAVIRQVNGRYSRQTLNLKPMLKGENMAPVSLEPFDIIFVPEKLF